MGLLFKEFCSMTNNEIFKEFRMRKQQNERFAGQNRNRNFEANSARNSDWNRTDEHFGGINHHSDFDHEFIHGSSNFSDRETRYPDRMTGRGDTRLPRFNSSEDIGQQGFSDEWGTSARSGHYGKGPKGWRRSDEHLKEEVSEALYRNQSVDATDIEVSAKDGLIILSGTVDSREAKRVAERCAENVSGIEDVQNNLRVKRNEAANPTLRDASNRFS